MSVTPVTEVSRLELFFDLVFVVTITQFTAVLEHRPSAAGATQAALMLAIVWWMYGGYAWLTNLVPPDHTARRLAMVAGMISYLVLALAIPRAFEGEGLAFGLAYLLVVIVHGGLFTVSTQVQLSTIYRGFFPVNVAFALVVVAGGALGGAWQYALWGLTAAAAWTSPYLIADQSHLLSAKHFVERHALVVLVAIGESVVAIAIGASAHDLDAGTITTVALGMAISAGLWWAYFGDHDDELRVAAFVRAVADGRRLVGVRPFGVVFAGLLGRWWRWPPACTTRSANPRPVDGRGACPVPGRRRRAVPGRGPDLARLPGDGRRPRGGWPSRPPRQATAATCIAGKGRARVAAEVGVRRSASALEGRSGGDGGGQARGGPAAGCARRVEPISARPRARGAASARPRCPALVTPATGPTEPLGLSR